MDPLAAALTEGYGIPPTTLTEVQGGADPYSRTYRAGDLFVKIVRRPAPTVALAAALRESGIEEVVAPVHARDGGLSWPFEDGRILVFPWLDAANGFDQPLPLAAWEAVGRALRRVHDFTGPVDLPCETFFVPGVESVAAVLAAPPRDEVGERLRQVLRAHEAAWTRRVAEVADLGAQCQAQPWDVVPCHADLHVGNILVDRAGRVHLADWDTARLAPRECDFLFFCAGGIGQWHGPAEEEAFWAGYGSWAVHPTALLYYQSARVVEDVVAYVDEALGTTGADTVARADAVSWVERLLC